ncbi:MAG TPA: carboxypeptidase regulatory-like domain-containing protein [Gammaproteobacteria bacterium]|nr:carboxypeptidase regulatory-like domain-containing protein [Gammaproteobacteria bacterium]
MRNDIFRTIACAKPVINVLILILLLPSSALEAGTSSLRTVFEAAPFEGKIVDSETDQPIPDAIVVVVWPRTTSADTGSNHTRVVELQEVLSDSSGHYKIPGWKKGKEEAGKGWFLKIDPVIIAYASGYWPRHSYNIMHYKVNREDNKLALNEVWESDWDGKSIKLKPMHSEAWNAEQWQHYDRALEILLFTVNYRYIESCGWIKLPYSLIARDRIRRKVYRFPLADGENKRRETYLSDMLTRRRFSLKKECGVDPKELFLTHGMSKEEFDRCCAENSTNRTDYNKKTKALNISPQPAITTHGVANETTHRDQELK